MTVTAFPAARSDFVAFGTLATRHLDKACRCLDVCVVIIVLGVAAFHAAFTVEDSYSPVGRHLHSSDTVPVTAVVEECGKHAPVLDEGLFGFKTAHRVARATDHIHVEFAKQRTIRILVQPIQPVESLDGLGRVARRFLEGNHHKAVRCKTANHALVCTRLSTSTRAPYHNGMLLVRIVGQALGVREDSFPIPAGIRLVLDFHVILFFFLVVREENFRHGGLRFFAGRRNFGRRACRNFASAGTGKRNRISDAFGSAGY